jgi:alkylation response protein AidB-like acyl-CoA dehydrogenase
MNLTYPPAAEEYRAKIRAFLAEHLPADWAGLGALSEEEALAFKISWRKVLYENDLLAPMWPKEYGGGGLTRLEQVVLAEEFAHAKAPTEGPNDSFSIDMLGNTVIEMGTEEQKAYLLPRILSGEMVWCQGYSEPEAGSDLASVRTKARLEHGEWVINGQKIWTSEAQTANWIFLVARTNPAASSSRGISFLLVPLDQPGIEIRPIKQMNGLEEFCETFFTDARTDASNIIGNADEGWQVVTRLLSHERGGGTSIELPIRFRADLDRLVELAREYGKLDDPGIRRRIGWCYERITIMRGLGLRAVTRFLADEPPAADSSIFKLFWSEYHVEHAKLGVEILGEAGAVVSGRQASHPYTDDPGAPNSTATWQGSLINALSETIYAGTSEIQRNILGERILGLPREARVPAVSRG